MSKIFDADSPLLRFLTRVADVMILNLLFVATAIPVVTIGASLTALNYTAMKLVAHESESVTDDYLRSFRSNFRQATVLGLVMGLLALVLWAWYVVATNLDVHPLVRLVLLAVVFLIAFRVVAAALYVFPYQAKFEGGVRDVLRNSRLMSIRHLFSTLTMLAVTVLPVVITVFYPRVTAYGLLWFLFGFAGIAVVNALVFTSVFSRYIPEPEPEPEPSAAVA